MAPETTSRGPGIGAALTSLAGEVVAGAPSFGPGKVFVFGTTPCGPCETAGPLGTCVVGPTPTCRPLSDARATVLKISNSSSDRQDRVTWRRKGAVASREGFDVVIEPVQDYSLCIYDESGVTPNLLFRATAPADDGCSGGTCWTGLLYRNRDRIPEGVKRLTLTEGHPPQRPAGKINLLGTGD